MSRALASVCLVLLAALAGAHASADNEPTVSVTGDAELRLAPDMARINMAVSHKDQTVKAAQQSVARVVNDFLELADDRDIDRKWITTTGASVRPNYKWDREKEEQIFTGYTVERQIQLELRDLEQLGPLLEDVGRIGINRVSPPVLDSTARRETHREVLALAFADAEANAEALADAAGADLGDALSISTSSSRPPVQPVMRAAAMEMADDNSASYNPGELTIRARVSAQFELEY